MLHSGAEPWKVKVLLPYVVQNTNSQAGTFGRIPVVDPQPYSPCSPTFKAQNSVTDVAETAIVDQVMTDFGQSVFGHRVLPANFDQSVFGQN